MARRFQPGWAIYKDQMDFLGFGDALWEPSPTNNHTSISVGDVAFLRRGQLFLLFHAATPLGERRLGEDVPDTFEQLETGPPKVTLARQPDCLSTSSVRHVGRNIGDTTLPPGGTSGFPFQLTENRNGAALITNYETYRVDAQVESPFEEYTKRHYKSWVAFGRDKGYANDVRPILITGFDVTRDFEMVAYSDEDTSVKYDVVTQDPTLGPVTTSFRSVERIRCSPHTQKGPWELGPLPPDRVIEFPSENAKEGDIPDDFNQCIFVRYYTMRLKKPERPSGLITAGPVPPGFALRGPNGEIAVRELVVESDGEYPDEDFEGMEYYVSDYDEDDDDDGIVVHNVPSDKEFDSWNIVADYVFKNSSAVSVLVHHRDLAGVRREGETDGIATLLEKRKPRVIVDEDGVGRLVPQENLQLEAPAEQPSEPAEAQ